MFIKNFLTRFWESPTLMMWGSFLGRGTQILIVLPVALAYFTPGEVVVWQLFIMIMGLQLLVDMGFLTTFIRLIAYGMGGADDINKLNNIRAKIGDGIANWATIERIVITLRKIYSRLSYLFIFFIGVIGTLALIKPISILEDTDNAWLAWVFALLASAIYFYGAIYRAYLQGTNHIALFRRWEAITYTLSSLTGIVVIILGGKLLALSVATYSWLIINFFVTQKLCHKVENGKYYSFGKNNWDKKILSVIWPSVWRSGIGIWLSAGVIYGLGIVYAQIAEASAAASLLLALNLMRQLTQFSQAPFYSKISLLARLHAEGNRNKLISLAQKGMRYSYLVLVVGIMIFGLIGASFLEWIGSETKFVNHDLWALLGLAFLVERYGAMHLQWYSVTNHIIWHIANGVTGVITIIAVLLLYNVVGIYSLPMALLIGNVGFYSWYSAMHSYSAFKLNFMKYESGSSLVPILICIIYLASIYY
jgi:hypothetical protein